VGGGADVEFVELEVEPDEVGGGGVDGVDDPGPVVPVAFSENATGFWLRRS
jgi:hypothetical protein